MTIMIMGMTIDMTMDMTIPHQRGAAGPRLQFVRISSHIKSLTKISHENVANASPSTSGAPSQNRSLPGLQGEIQDLTFSRAAANLLQPVMPSACLRGAQMVETASGRAACTGSRHRQRSQFHTARSVGGLTRSWYHQPTTAAVKAEATRSSPAADRLICGNFQARSASVC